MRTRVTILTLLVGLMTGLLAGPAVAAVDTGAESRFVTLLNAERAAAGLPGLSVASDLVAVARDHSATMAAGNNLHHNPNLATDVTNWQSVGENVGRGPVVDAIHDAFMNSPTHRANIVDSDWTQVGIGVEVVNGTIWVTQVFREPEAATAPAPAPAPAPEPAPAPAPAPAPQPASATSAPTTTEAAAPAPAASATPTVGGTVDRALVLLARVESDTQGISVEDLLDS